MSCGTTPMSSLTAWASLVTECPAMRASPPLGRSRQESIEMVVLLPAPLGPSRLKISPSAMSKLTPSTATTPLGGSYCFRRSWTSTMLTGRSSRPPRRRASLYTTGARRSRTRDRRRPQPASPSRLRLGGHARRARRRSSATASQQEASGLDPRPPQHLTWARDRLGARYEAPAAENVRTPGQRPEPAQHADRRLLVALAQGVVAHQASARARGRCRARRRAPWR